MRKLIYIHLHIVKKTYLAAKQVKVGDCTLGYFESSSKQGHLIWRGASIQAFKEKVGFQQGHTAHVAFPKHKDEKKRGIASSVLDPEN